MKRETAADQIRSDIFLSLEYDIISFADVEGAAVEAGLLSLTERREVIFDVLCELVAANQILIGDALKATGCVEFHPWPDKGAALRERLERTSASFEKPYVGDGFWIGRPSDAV